VGRSLNPALGFLAAWTFLVLSTVFMVTAALPLGVATLRLIAPAYESSAPLAADLGAEIAGLTGAALAIGVVPLVYFQARLRSPFCSDARERHPRQR
jgi:hypothetical protein